MNLLGKLRLRLTTINAVASGIILLAMALGSLFFTREQFIDSSANAFAHAADTIAYQIQSAAVIQSNSLAQIELAQGFLIHIEDGGRPILWPGVLQSKTPRDVLIGRAWEKAKENGIAPDRMPLTAKSYISTIQGDSGESYRFAVWVLPGSRGWNSVTILFDRSGEQASLRNLTLVFVGGVLLGIVALSLFSFVFAGRAIRPIERANRQQKQFVQAASHELRSPIAVIQADADALLKAPPEDLPGYAAMIRQQSRHMARLVDDMLFLASADAQSFQMQFAPVEIAGLLREAAESFRPLMQERGLEFSYEPTPLPLAWGDETRLRQVIHILLDNAMEYTLKGGQISLAACCHGRTLQIMVSDNGPGIADEHKVHIFDRFYRADKARGRGKAHYGLGLSIAWEIVTLHQGLIQVTDRAGGGAVFTLSLKAERP